MSTPTGRCIAIGDIHGCIHALDALLNEIRPTPDDVIICLGDFVDTGRDAKAVIDRLLQLRNECRLITIQGNHEEMLLGAFESERLKDSWLMCGGIATLNSYKFCGDIDVIEPEHLKFIKECRDYFETDSHILVHANYDAELPMGELPSHTLRWSQLDDPQPQRHVSGKTVVVGHSEQKSGEILDLGSVICIDTFCHGYGWLTALELNTGQIWQASRWGQLREPDDDLSQIKKVVKSIKSPPADGA